MEDFVWIEVKPGRLECQKGKWLLRAEKQAWPAGPNLFAYHMWKGEKPAGANGYNLPTLEAAQRGAEETYTMNVSA